MALFEYSLPAEPCARAFLQHPSQRIHRPIVHLRVALPIPRAGFRAFEWVNTLLDTGANCGIFGQLVADSLGLTRPADAEELDFRTASGNVRVWLTRLRLHLGWPTEAASFDWEATVGITTGDSFAESVRSGLLGIGGGLEVFHRFEVNVNPDGLEMPVVRIVTP